MGELTTGDAASEMDELLDCDGPASGTGAGRLLSGLMLALFLLEALFLSQR